MRFKNALVLEQFAGKLHSLSDGLHRDLAAPGPDDSFPRCAIGDLFQHLKDHDARSFESGLAMADLRVGNNVLAKFHGRGLAIDFSFHTAFESVCFESSFGKQVLFEQALACPTASFHKFARASPIGSELQPPMILLP
jgi:hypothetical protein